MPSQITTDHDVIKKWVEDRGGHPSVVRATEGKRPTRSKTGGGLLRVEFRDPEDKLDEVDWDGFFDVFEENHLAFLHYDKRKDGKISRFSRFLLREDAPAPAPKPKAAAKHKAAKPK